jgi:hypothetical protein
MEDHSLQDQSWVLDDKNREAFQDFLVIVAQQGQLFGANGVRLSWSTDSYYLSTRYPKRMVLPILLDGLFTILSPLAKGRTQHGSYQSCPLHQRHSRNLFGLRLNRVADSFGVPSLL